MCKGRGCGRSEDAEATAESGVSYKATARPVVADAGLHRASKCQLSLFPRLSVGLKQLFAQSYCQRCSEVFRDHIIREKPNSAGCSRARACDECAKVLTHFTGDLPDHKGLWDRIDAKGYAKVRRSKPKPKPTRGFV